jgi:hypothetical protein
LDRLTGQNNGIGHRQHVLLADRWDHTGPKHYPESDRNADGNATPTGTDADGDEPTRGL